MSAVMEPGQTIIQACNEYAADPPTVLTQDDKDFYDQLLNGKTI